MSHDTPRYKSLYDSYKEMYDPDRVESYKSLEETYRQLNEAPVPSAPKKAGWYGLNINGERVYRYSDGNEWKVRGPGFVTGDNNSPYKFTAQDDRAQDMKRMSRDGWWNQTFKGTPLGRPLNDTEKQSIRQGQQRANDNTINRQGVERATSTSGGMTQGDEDARTNIPRTDAQGNRIFTDKDRPSGFHTIKKDGQDIRRYWDGKQWLVDKPGFRMGAETPNDPGAQAIRRSENPLNAVPKVFDMQRGSDNPLDTIGDQAGKAWNWITGQGPGPQDIKGTEDPLKLSDKTGLRPQNAAQAPGKSGVDDFNAATQDIRRKPGTFDNTGVDKTTVAGDSPPSDPPSAPSQNLTPMQQWAKNFPQLAAKVKPGAAGYDEIQKMNKPSSTPAATPAATPVRTAVRQAIKTPKVNVPKLNNSTPSNVSSQFKSPKPLINMNTIRTEETEIIQSLLAEGLELQEAQDTLVMAYLYVNDMVDDEESARVVVTHMTEEAKLQIIENVGDTVGEFGRNFTHSIWRGGHGKKIRPDANPFHRAANAIVRGGRDFVTGVARGATGNKNTVTSGSESSSTPSKPESVKPESAKPESAKPESDKPASSKPASAKPASAKPESAKPTPPKTETKSTGSGRLDSALKWASDPKNKDAWMKEHKTQHEVYSSIADAYNEISEGRKDQSGMSDSDKMAARNKDAGYKSDNDYATDQRRGRAANQRGVKKQKGSVTGKPSWMKDSDYEAHKQSSTKDRLARKYPNTAPGQRVKKNDAMDKAEGGGKGRRGS